MTTGNCIGCNLSKKALPLYGEGAKKLLIVTDCATPEQNCAGSRAVGSHIRFIKDRLYRYGISLEADCWLTSAVLCESREQPTRPQVNACKPNLEATISSLKPKVVLLIGEAAAYAGYGDTVPGGVYLDRVHGFTHNCRRHSCHMIATYIPGSDNRRYSVRDRVIERDLHMAVIALVTPYKVWKDELACVRAVSGKEAVKRLTAAVNDTQRRWMAYDYETTGLKPHNDEHRIISCAIADNEDSAYAFMMTDEVKPAFRRWLDAPHIRKIAHNLAFELSWNKEKMGTYGESMDLDTIIAAHIWDNRDRSAKGIGFLAPMLLGCRPWDNVVSPYMEPDPAEEKRCGDNAVNSLMNAPPREVLLYNAIDALVEFRVAIVLMRLLKYHDLTLPYDESIEMVTRRVSCA